MRIMSIAKALPLLVAYAALAGACRQMSPPPSAVAECPAFSSVDPAGLPTHVDNDPTDASFEVIWAHWAAEEDGISWRTVSPLAKVRLETSPGGLSTDLVVRAVTGRRSASGWEIYARTRETLRNGDWTDWQAIHLPTQTGEKLDAILGDPCLWNAPRFLDAEVRLRNGRYDSRPDGPITLYDVTQDGRRWGGMHISWQVGAPAQLRALLVIAAFGEPAFVEPDIGPDGWLDRPSSTYGAQ